MAFLYLVFIEGRLRRGSAGRRAGGARPTGTVLVMQLGMTLMGQGATKSVRTVETGGGPRALRCPPRHLGCCTTSGETKSDRAVGSGGRRSGRHPWTLAALAVCYSALGKLAEVDAIKRRAPRAGAARVRAIVNTRDYRREPRRMDVAFEFLDGRATSTTASSSTRSGIPSSGCSRTIRDGAYLSRMGSPTPRAMEPTAPARNPTIRNPRNRYAAGRPRSPGRNSTARSIPACAPRGSEPATTERRSRGGGTQRCPHATDLNDIGSMALNTEYETGRGQEQPVRATGRAAPHDPCSPDGGRTIVARGRDARTASPQLELGLAWIRRRSVPFELRRHDHRRGRARTSSLCL